MLANVFVFFFFNGCLEAELQIFLYIRIRCRLYMQLCMAIWKFVPLLENCDIFSFFQLWEMRLLSYFWSSFHCWQTCKLYCNFHFQLIQSFVWSRCNEVSYSIHTCSCPSGVSYARFKGIFYAYDDFNFFFLQVDSYAIMEGNILCMIPRLTWLSFDCFHFRSYFYLTSKTRYVLWKSRQYHTRRVITNFVLLPSRFFF